MESEAHLIVGLGNPGPKYEKTRHNLGFLVVRALAEKHGLKFRAESAFKGELASGRIEGRELLLLLPTTYMNLSGTAVRKVVDYYKIGFMRSSYFLVIVDDVYLTFGNMRVRAEGGSGGHNGLKSIAASLNSEHYSRLRMGVGPDADSEIEDLVDYVLGAFRPEEIENLPELIERGVLVVECWLRQGLEVARQYAGQLKRRK